MKTTSCGAPKIGRPAPNPHRPQTRETRWRACLAVAYKCFAHILVAAIAVTILAACSNTNSTVPSAQRASIIPASKAIGGTPTPSPCKPPGKFWYFRGSCKAYAMKKGGTLVSLDPYHGLTFTMIWPGDHPPQSTNRFVTGDAIGDGDITGKFDGSIFPLYGTKKCIDRYFRTTTCIGTAFLYTVTANTTSFEIGWDHAPKVEVTNAKGYPGSTCREIQLLDIPGRGWLWMLWPVKGKPVGSTLVIEASHEPLSIPTNSTLLLGLICY